VFYESERSFREHWALPQNIKLNVDFLCAGVQGKMKDQQVYYSEFDPFRLDNARWDASTWSIEDSRDELYLLIKGRESCWLQQLKI
jgi:hypothetical protein